MGSYSTGSSLGECSFFTTAELLLVVLLFE